MNMTKGEEPASPHPRGTMTLGSLFSGIGMFEVGIAAAFEASGLTIETRWQVEADPYCRRILARHWPDTLRFDNVRSVGAHNLPPVDCICGGFPCQDISVAGGGAGLAGKKSGLFFELARIVRELEPQHVVLENVPAITSRGLPEVLGELEDLGYDTQWGGISASEMGAPHLRERWILIGTRRG